MTTERELTDAELIARLRGLVKPWALGLEAADRLTALAEQVAALTRERDELHKVRDAEHAVAKSTQDLVERMGRENDDLNRVIAIYNKMLRAANEPMLRVDAYNRDPTDYNLLQLRRARAARAEVKR
jgi:hypothetical protein